MPQQTETLYIVISADGLLTADQDRDAAVERMRDDACGDEPYQVIEQKITFTPPVDVQSTLTVPATAGEVVSAVV